MRLTAALVLTSFCAASSSKAEPPKATMQDFMVRRGYQAVPMSRDLLNHMFIKGRVNGSRITFQLDTGASRTYLDPSRAGRMKRLGKDKAGGLFGFETGEIDIVAIDKIELAGTVISNQPARVLSMHAERQIHTGSLIPKGHPLTTADALLGLDFLMDTHAFIDCAAPALYLRAEKPEVQTAENMHQSLLISGFVSLPVRVVQGKLVVDGVVNRQEASFILDTGSPASLFDLHQLENFGLSRHETILRALDIGAKETEQSYTPLTSLQLGEYEEKNFHIGVVELGKRWDSVKAGGGPPLVGLIGVDLLALRAGTLIDCSAAKLYLRLDKAK